MSKNSYTFTITASDDPVNLFKFLVCSVVMGIIVLISKILFPLSGSLFTKIGILFLYAIIGIVVYFTLAALLGIPELRMFKRFIGKNSKL